MKKNKTPLERMVVVPRKPGGQWAFYLAAVFSVLVILAIGFGVGMVFGEKFALLQWKELRESREAVVNYEARVSEQDAELARLRVGAEIDRQSSEELRLSVVAKEHELADLSEEIGFYHELMASSPSERGLSLHHLVLTATDKPNVYKYKLVLKQLASRHNLLTVAVKMSLNGSINNVATSLDFSEISPIFESSEHVVRFRYFINVEGELELPQGFQPSVVVFSARTVGGKSQNIASEIEWAVKER